MGIVYRGLTTLEELEACIRLQIKVWGFRPIDVVPGPLLIIGKKYGGFLYGAFDDDKLVGFVYSLPGQGHSVALQWSHMTAVDPEYQSQGIGEKLKQLQWEYARAQGYPLIAWTFDPLETRNAYFNFQKLGVVARFFEPNAYGITTGRAHYGLPTDRLIAEWWTQWSKTQSLPHALPHGTSTLISMVWKDGRPYPKTVHDPRATDFWLPIPAENHYPQTKISWKNYRKVWQDALREAFTRTFTAGFVALSFQRNIPGLNTPGYHLMPTVQVRPPLPSW